MAALAMVFDSLDIGNSPYFPVEPLDWGSQAVADTLLTGFIRPEEFDQVAAEANLTRTVVIPMNIRSSSADASLTDQQALVQRLAAANRFVPKTLTVTPANSTHVSTFKVIGGTWQSDYTMQGSLLNVISGTLTLICQWPVYGAAQNIGSSGTPIVANTASPAVFTVTPSPTGDVPADITLFVKNRDAASARSLMVSTISGNTTWNNTVDSSAWTLGTPTFCTVATTVGPPTTVKANGTFAQNTVEAIASWTQPTLPTDRRFKVWMRTRDNTTTTRGTLQFRLRHVTGTNQVIGAWVSIPVDASSNTYQGCEMGTWPFPLGNISGSGASTTTTYLEMMSTQNNGSSGGVDFDFVFYTPEDSTITFETEDTSTVVAAAAATVQVESDMCYLTSDHSPAGTVAKGAHIRSLGGSRYCVLLSHGFLAGLDSALQWDACNIDAYATVTPRYIGLA